jgi:hypothetical protein
MTIYTIYLCNAFSLSMLNREEQANAKGVGAPWGDSTAPYPRIPRPIEDPRAWLEQLTGQDGERIVSAVGHADTARIFSEILGREVEPNRVSVQLKYGNSALIGQYVGPRLPEGATELPEGARIEWWVI